MMDVAASGGAFGVRAGIGGGIDREPPPPRAAADMGQWIKDLATGNRTFAARLADRQSQAFPSEDPDYGDLGLAFPAWTGPGQDAILQPPKPEIPPSPLILQRAPDRDADYEAAE